jgi:hypothetical protein
VLQIKEEELKKDERTMRRIETNIRYSTNVYALSTALVLPEPECIEL